MIVTNALPSPINSSVQQKKKKASETFFLYVYHVG